MNCIILLLLLGCCGGWGNGGCGAASDSCNGIPMGNGGGRNPNRRNPDERKAAGRIPEPDCGRRPENCCQDSRPEPGDGECGCADVERESCEIPGMIPPPWQDQEYPRFPRREGGEDCEA